MCRRFAIHSRDSLNASHAWQKIKWRRCDAGTTVSRAEGRARRGFRWRCANAALGTLAIGLPLVWMGKPPVVPDIGSVDAVEWCCVARWKKVCWLLR
jgi:hypothetical protein